MLQYIPPLLLLSTTLTNALPGAVYPPPPPAPLPDNGIWTLLPSPPCGDVPFNQLPNEPSYIQPFSIKPNICLNKNDQIAFDLTCTNLPAQAPEGTSPSLVGTLIHYYRKAISLTTAPDANELTLINGNPFYESDCKLANGKESGPCTQVTLKELPPPDPPGPDPPQHFTAGGVADILDTLRVLPGIENALQCRIDVHKGDLYFGVGCIQKVDNYVSNGTYPCPDIPEPHTLKYVPGGP